MSVPRGCAGRAEHWLLASLAVAALLAWWLAPGPAEAPPPGISPEVHAPAAVWMRSGGAASAAVPPPLAAATMSPQERAAQVALWAQRLARAQQTLERYRQQSRYPAESRPAEEHPDQLHPFRPIAEDRPLRMPGGSVTEGVRLRTTQERIFLAGDERSRVTVALVDGAGQALPLRVVRAVLHEVPEPGRPATAPEQPFALQPAAAGGFEGVIHPAAQGFGASAGTLRLEMDLEYAGQPGFLYFDVIYSPELAARWLPGVGDSVEQGDLHFTLRAQVLQPGRYVVSGRIDDAQGRPVALAQFNRELAAGAQPIVLPVAGRLLHDRTPAFPLALRDVEAFLLKPDAFPDRVMLPRLPGVLHRSAVHPLSAFSDAEAQGDQRTRYLAEFEKDVRQAEAALQQLQAEPGKPPGP